MHEHSLLVFRLPSLLLQCQVKKKKPIGKASMKIRTIQIYIVHIIHVLFTIKKWHGIVISPGVVDLCRDGSTCTQFS